MRYEDSSNTGSSNQANPEARNDTDALAAGSREPATGNVITGRGTQSGAKGADDAHGAHVVAITGAHGTDTSHGGGHLAVNGEFGRLSIDAEGNYSYQARANAPENSRDVFTYKLADASGHSADATLTIEIGKTPAVVRADAHQMVVGPDGLVVLPAGVELSDVHVVGRNLVIDMPDGSQMLILDGAVFVPRLVLGDVEVPATNLAALLIDSEPKPAAGPPQSSGGNFAVPLGPLDPGVPLGDLIPPTQLAYVPPDYREVGLLENNKPTILIETPNQPLGVHAATASVNESALPARGLEPAGSDSASTAETTTGTIVYTSLDTPNTISVAGVIVTGVGQTIPLAYGALVITSIGNGTIGYSYTLADNTLGDNTQENVAVVIRDSNGDTDSATLTISIIDDVPIARADVDSVTEDGPLVADGNVLTGVGGSDANATDGVADTPGADGITLTGIAFGNTAGTVGSAVLGAYGSLVIGANGNYSYTLNNALPAVQALGANQTLSETFTYTITDGDGDVRSTTLTITINGTNDRPTILAGTATVSEEGLAGGIPDSIGLPTDSSNSATVSGQLAVADVDNNALTVTLGAPAGAFTSHGQSVGWSVSSDGHVLTGSAGGATVVTVTLSNTGSYTVVLAAPLDHPNAGGEDVLSLVIPVAVNDGTVSVSSTLTVSVEDDSPVITSAPVIGAGVVIDETDGANPVSSGAPIVRTSDGAILSAGVNFGADHQGSTTYALTLSGGGGVGSSIASGLHTSNGNAPITLTLTSATLITATYNGGSQTAFTIAMNANGTITVSQFTALGHPIAGSTAAAFDDAINLVANGVSLVGATAVYRDFDGDSTTASAGIGNAITFRDDGPSINLIVHLPTGGDALTAIQLTTSDDGTEGAGFTSASTAAAFGGTFSFNPDGGGDGTASAGINYALSLLVAPGTASGLGSNGQSIFLYNIGGTIVGSTSTTAPASIGAASVIFTIASDTAGAVTLTQFAQIDHPSEAPNSGAPFADQLAILGNGLVQLTATATIVDNDGDFANDSRSLDLGNFIRFADDGPHISAALVPGATIRIDETDGVAAAGGEVDPIGGNLGTVTMAASSLYTVSTVAPSADSPTTNRYALAISAPGVASGLLLSTTNQAIVLVNNNGAIEGHVANPAGAIAFTVSIDATSGAVTLTQYLAVEHFNPTSPNEDSIPLAPGVLTINVTATDFDGDTDVASVDLGAIIRFQDDAPLPVADVDSIGSGAFGPATGNVITGVDVATGFDSNTSDGSKDNVGADGAVVAGVAKGDTGADLVSAGTVGTSIAGNYGTLTLNADGSYNYVRTAGTPGGVSDVFTYTLKDGDGDLAHTTLTINIGDAGVTTTIPTAAGQTTVYEAALGARGAGESQGTSEALAPGANDDPREAVSGTITFVAKDGLGSISLGGTTLNLAGGYPQTVNTSVTGTLVVTGVTYDATTGAGSIAYTYTLLDNTLGDPSSVSFALTVTDSDPAPGADSSSGNLVINIIDDAPLPVADVDSIGSGAFGPATGNVITGVDVATGFDSNTSDGSKDNVGADGAVVAGVAKGDTGADLVSAGTVGTSIAGNYGTLTLNADGSYNYVRTAGTPGGVSDVFTYTLKDGDGDLAHTTLTINIGDAGVTTTIPTAAGQTTVYEAALGARGAGESQGTSEALAPGANDDPREAVSGTITFVAKDGLGSISLGGTTLNLAGGYPQTVNTSVTGTLVVTGVTYDATTGAGSIAYTYTLLDNTLGDPSSVSFALTVTDSDPAPGADSSSGNLVINIIDDAPLPVADVDSIGSGAFGPATGNVITGVDVATGFDSNTSDGSKDNVGADGAVVAGVAKGDTGADLVSAGTVGTSIAGNYGTLTLNADGSYNYVRTAGTPGGVSDVFTYTLKDGDGDLAHTTLTINIGDAGVTTTIPTAAGQTTVYEAALGARGAGESQGTSEALAPGANDDPREAVSGTITFVAKDGLGSISLGGTTLNLAGGYPQTVNTSVTGTLVVTGVTYDATTGAGSIAYTYTLLDNTLGDPSSVSFALTVTDSDPAPGADSSSGNLVINIIDDAPLPVADVDSIGSGAFGPATGNVITGVDVATGFDSNTSDGSKDNVGADGAVVAGVAKGDTGADLVSAGTVGTSIAGNYGTLTLNADGSYNYVRTAGTPGGVSDVFTYTLKDGDGDLAHTTLTINIGDAGVTTTIPTAAGQTTVYEAALGARGAGESQGTSEALAPGANDDPREAVSGTITFVAKDGLGSISLGGTTLNLAGGYPQTVNTSVTGTLVVTGVTYDATTGAGSIAYTYTLLDNTLGDPSSVSFALTVTDSDPAPGADSSSGNLVINIIDDAPLPVADVDSIGSGAFGPATGNVITGVDVATGFDSNTSDGSKDNVGADGAVVAGVAKGDTGADLVSAGTVGTSIAGNYGTLTLNADGSYNYVRTAGTPGGVSDVFTYTLKDGDGDLAHTTLTINIGDAGVTTTIPTAAGQTTVYEAALGARGAGESQGTSEALAPGANDDPREAVSGTITFVAKDGLGSISLGGTTLNLAGGYPQTVNTSVTGTLVVTGVTYDATTGAGSIAYTYTLLDNTLGDPSSVSFALTVTDSDPAPGADSSSGNLVINIIDDAPLPVADVDSIGSGAFGPATGNVITGVDVATGFDSNTSDGSKDNVGADGAVVAGVAKGDTGADLVSAGTVGTSIAGNYGTLTLNADGSYNYVRTAGTPGGVSDVFTYTLKDGDGDLAHTTLTINIGDAGVTTTIPTAAGQTTVYEAALGARGAGESQGTSEALAPGANDDPREAVSGTITFVAKDGLGSISLGGTTLNLAGGYPQTVNTSVTGTLVVTGVTYDATTGAGSIAYTYTLLDNTLGDPSSVSFALTVTDSDPAPGADSSSGNLVINIIDDAPIAHNDSDTISEDAAPVLGNVITGAGTTEGLGGSGTDLQGADGAIVAGIKLPASATYDAVSAALAGTPITGTYGTLTIHQDGSYSYALNNASPLVQGLDQGEQVTDTFSYQLKDADGDLAPATLTINVTGVNDPPSANPDPARISDEGVTGGNTDSVGTPADLTDSRIATGNLNITDPDGTTSFTIGLTAPVGLTADGQAISWTGAGTGLLVGTVLGGTVEVLRIAVTNTGAYTVTLSHGIDHPTVGVEDVLGISIPVSISDGIATTSSAIQVTIEDDSPLIVGTPGQMTLTGLSATSTFAYSIGGDSHLVFDTAADNHDIDVVGLTAKIGGTVYSGIPVTLASASPTSESYHFSFNYDANPDPAITDTHTASGTLTFDKAGHYTVTLDAPIAGYSFSSVQNDSTITFYNPIGGASQFATAVAAFTGGNFYAQFTGKDVPITATGNDGFQNNDLFGGTQTYVNISSTAIGVKGNSIQAGNVLDVDFTATNPGGVDATPSAATPSAYIRIAQYGNEDFVVVLKLADPSNPSSFITRAIVVNSDDVYTQAHQPGGLYPVLGSGQALVIIEQADYAGLAGVPAGYQLVGFQLVTSTEGLSGDAYNFNGLLGATDFTTTSFTTAKNSATNDQDVIKILDVGVALTTNNSNSLALDFTVKATDADGDSTAPVHLLVNTATVITPIVLDTNHDGVIHYLGLDAGVHYDYNGDGQAEATAWVAPGDSILVRDADGNGTVTNASEFVFGGNGVTDLEALHAQYGDQLDANDAGFVQFMVWNDANSNGIADPGELQSLTDAGIVSISLVSNGVTTTAAGGDVVVAGEAKFTYVNDNGERSTGLVADAGFRTGDRDSELTQRMIGAGNGSAVVTAAVAAMGLAATQAAAQDHHDTPAPAAAVSVASVTAQLATTPVSVAHDDVTRTLLGNEVKTVAHDEPAPAAHPTTEVAPSPHAEVATPVTPATTALVEASAPTHDSAPPALIATNIVIPSIAAFQASEHGQDTASVQRAVTVEKVLAEALHGGTGGGDIDTILAALPGHANGENPALAALASPNDNSVSGWDMGPTGHLSGAALANIVTDMTVFHHDAVQPAING